MYLFDPTQYKEFGLNYYDGDNFSYRYQISKKLFFKTIYIPLGPNCYSKQGFNDFVKHITSLRFTKIKIDLPIVYSQKVISDITKKLKLAGFKKSNYIQDEETLLVLPDYLNFNGKELKKVRNGKINVDIITKQQLSNNEIDEIYKIYKDTAKNLDFKPKAKATFKKISETGLTTLALNKQTQKIEGFLLNSIIEADLTDIVNKKDGKVMTLIYTGLTDTGREYGLGHAIHYESFKSAFDNFGIDVVDFHGASRTKDRTYLRFKNCFSKNYFSLPGSFKRVRFL